MALCFGEQGGVVRIAPLKWRHSLLGLNSRQQRCGAEEPGRPVSPRPPFQCPLVHIHLQSPPLAFFNSLVLLPHLISSGHVFSASRKTHTPSTQPGLVWHFAFCPSLDISSSICSVAFATLPTVPNLVVSTRSQPTKTPCRKELSTSIDLSLFVQPPVTDFPSPARASPLCAVGKAQVIQLNAFVG